jgi:ubiquinone/menaquinone biosynthesis C-methylase UbiE
MERIDSLHVVADTVERGTDAGYLQTQYGTTERLRIRIEAHQRYSERADDFLDWVLEHLNPRAGDLVLDVGCGTGGIHRALCRRGIRALLGVDSSPAMVAASQQQANEHGLPIVTIQGEAEHLPVPDSTYDRVMANHMLFYVADQYAALRELRRVLQANGRVVLTTNAHDHTAALYELHVAAAERLGYVASGRVGHRFSLDHLELVRNVLPSAQRFVREDAFVFPTTDAALRFYATSGVDAIENCPADGSHRARLMALVGEQIEAIIHREGVFRVPKNAGCFVADV